MDTDAPKITATRTAPREITGFGLGRRLGLVRVAQVGLLAGILVIWYTAAHTISSPVWTSDPLLIGAEIWREFQSGRLLINSWATLEESIAGFAGGFVLGTLAAFILTRFPTLGSVLNPYIGAAYALPRVALAPFFVLWFGIGLGSKAALGTSMVFFPVFFNVAEGIRSVNPDLIAAFHTMRASQWTMTRHVILPSLTPWFLAAARTAIGMALVGAVIGELIGSNRGLGWRITNAINLFDMTGALAALCMMGVLAAVLYAAVAIVERRALRWRNGTGATVEKGSVSGV